MSTAYLIGAFGSGLAPGTVPAPAPVTGHAVLRYTHLLQLNTNPGQMIPVTPVRLPIIDGVLCSVEGVPSTTTPIPVQATDDPLLAQTGDVHAQLDLVFDGGSQPVQVVLALPGGSTVDVATTARAGSQGAVFVSGLTPGQLAELHDGLATAELLKEETSTFRDEAATAQAEAQDAADRATAIVVADVDPTMATLIDLPQSETAAALAGRIGTLTGITGAPESQALAHNADGGTLTVALTMHSLGYGQDTTSAQTLPPVNGASQTRSVTPPPLVFADALAKVAKGAGSRVVVNQTRPGDQTQIGAGNAVSRWATGSSGDVEIFWLDTNDALNYGGFGTGRLTPAQSAEGLRILIERAINRGAQPIVLGGLPVNNATSVRRIQAFSEGHRRIAERYGAPYVDVAELLRGLPRATARIWGTSEAVHLSPASYAMIGAKLAALVGPHGVNPRTVAPGSLLRMNEWQHAGGTALSRQNGGAGVVDGTTIKIAAGETVTFPVRAIVPVQPVIEFANVVNGSGNGTGRILYADGQAGIPSIHIDTAGQPRGLTFARGHVMDTGPDLITIVCDTGSLEISTIRFTAAEHRRFAGLRVTNDVALSTSPRPSLLTGLIVAGGATPDWAFAVDEHLPINLTAPGGSSLAPSRFDFNVILPEPSGTGRMVGVGVGAGIATEGISYWLTSGWIIFRSAGNATENARLKIRPWASGAIGADVVVDGVFPATGEWRGVISTEFLDDGSMRIYVGGVLRHTVAAANQPFRHFVPMVGGNLGPADRITTLAVSAQGHAATI